MKRNLAALLAALPWSMTASPPARAQAALPVHVVVRSNGDCPGGPAVANALWAIRPDSEWPVLSANIDVVAEQADITLDLDGAHRRRIPLPADCEERANRIALIIAVWSDELSGHAAEPPGPAVPVVVPVSVVVPVPAPAAPPAKRSAMVAELGLLGFYSMQGTAALGGKVEVLLRRGGWWGLRAVAGYQPAKAIRVDIGASNYDRTLVGATFAVQWERSRVFLAGDGGLAAAFDRARGDGYSQNQSAFAVNVGLVAGGRVGTRLGRCRIWADLALYRWAREETLEVEPVVAGTPTRHSLPSWDAHAGLGLGVVFD